MEKWLEIDSPIIKVDEKSLDVIYEIKVHDSEDVHIMRIWFETSDVDQTAISSTASGVLVGLIPMSLKEGYDIKCNVPVDPELVHNLSKTVIPALCKNDLRFREPVLDISKYKIEKVRKIVGTGLSLGVDSFCTIDDYSKCSISEFKLNQLVFFNMYGKIDKGVIESTDKVSNELNLPIVYYSSNICTVMEDWDAYIPCHPFFMASTILTLGRFDKYLFASGCDWTEVRLSNMFNADLAYSDPIIVPNLSTTNTSFYSVGLEYTRSQKTEIVSANSVATRYVSPCLTNFVGNCGWCYKCKRTLVTADVGGYLNRFSHVFNLDEYAECRCAYLYYLCEMKNDKHLADVYNKFKQQEPKLCATLESKIPDLKRKYVDTPGWIVSTLANEGKLGAMRRLSYLYLNGVSENGRGDRDMLPNIPKAIFWAKKCSKSKDLSDIFQLVTCLSKGSTSDK